MEHKKYCVMYCSGATGFGWEEEFDRLSDFEDFVDQMRTEYTASVKVWDYQLERFIFWKNVLTIEPSIDLLGDLFRDMRTSTRRMK